MVSILTLGAIGAYLWQFETAQRDLQQATVEQAERRAIQLVDAMAAHMDQLVRGLDLALLQLREEYLGGAGFEKAVQSVLGTLGDGALERVAVLSADGFVMYSSIPLTGSIDVRDREHFRFHAEGGGADRLHISEPIFSRVTQTWTVLLTRPILRQGRFAGIIVVSVSPAQLSAHLARVALEKQDIVVLLRSDGKFLARNRDWTEAMGKAIVPDRPFLRPGSPDDGVFHAPASLDGTKRIFAWQRLDLSRLVVVVGLAEDALLAPLLRESRREQRRGIAVAVLMLLLGGGVSLLLVRMARQQRVLAASEERYRRLHESMVDAYVQTDMAGRLVEWNPAYEEMLGYGAEELARKTYAELTPERWHEMEARVIAEQVLTRGHSEVYEKEYLRADGSVFPVELRTFLLRNDREEAIGMWAIVRDISERKRAEAHIHHLAHHDALTGLANRLALHYMLEPALAVAHRAGAGVAVILIDLDRFKTINDTLGHLAGDRLLIEVAQRLKASVRDSDLIARLGGDEFVVAVTQVSDIRTVQGVAEKIRTLLAQPYEVDGHELHTTPSMGISLFPRDGQSVETLIRNADAAMYHAKAQGRDNWQFYDDRISEVSAERHRLEAALRGALERGELLLHFQPQMEVASGRIVAVEALVRWQHPEMGLVEPDSFIPVAEDMGLIASLGEWVLDQACRQISRWREEGLAGLRVAVNLSALQLCKQGLYDCVVRILDRHSLSAADLELEVTESMAMRNPAETIEILGGLNRLGVMLAIDDFGTGYSSLAYLKLLPIHRLKLDRSFVGDIETDPGDAAICRATASLTHDLGLVLVAEGVESEAQFRFLKGLGCDLVQGYWLSRPLPAAEAREMILRHNATAANAGAPI